MSNSSDTETNMDICEDLVSDIVFMTAELFISNSNNNILVSRHLFEDF